MNIRKDVCALARASILLLLCLFATTVTITAQQTTGDILGTVTDNSGAVVPGATITVENVATHESRTATTSASGDFVVNLLIPGNYSVSAAARGFQNFVVSSVMLSAGDRIRVNPQMAVGSASETITVESEGSVLKTDSSVLSTTITPQETQDLPLNGRNFVQLAQLSAGANEGPQSALTNGSELDDRRQSASISINGQSDVLNNVMMDGADNNERLIGTVAVRPSVEAISEMSVQSNTYTAEVGRTGGGIINVITKSGANQFHGSVFEFFRNDKLRRNLAERRSIAQTGGSLESIRGQPGRSHPQKQDILFRQLRGLSVHPGRRAQRLHSTHGLRRGKDFRLPGSGRLHRHRRPESHPDSRAG